MRKVTPPKRELGSFEGRYPTDMFNKTFVLENQVLGHVAKDSGNTIVVFGESDNTRYDIPRSEVIRLGGRITICEPSRLESFRRDKDSPLPQEILRPSAEEIRRSAIAQRRHESQRARTRADLILKERKELAAKPRTSTTKVSFPAGYNEEDEAELVKKIRKGVEEFKELFYATSKAAKKKAQEKKQQLREKNAEAETERISEMGSLAVQFTEDYDRIIEAIRKRPYSDQADMFDGLATLMSYQRELAVARRDIAKRVASSVKESTYPKESVESGRLRSRKPSGSR